MYNSYDNWSDARQRCRSLSHDVSAVRRPLQFDLVSIRIKEEAEFIAKLVSGSGSTFIRWDTLPWIGLHQSDSIRWGKPKWSDGSVVRYKNWAYREPSDYQVCIIIT